LVSPRNPAALADGIVEVLRNPGRYRPRPSAVRAVFDPDRSIAAQRAYIAAFFDLHLRHRDDDLLDGPSPAYPEIEFVR
jgi:hypothetical protein